MIIYFSGTGNSEHVANKIAILTNEKVFSINKAIKEKMNCSFIDEDRLILVCPTYAWQIPHIVKEFIKNSQIKENTKIYFIMTCGGEIANAYKYNEDLAREMKLTYMGTFPILMPDNYIIMFKAISKEKARKMIEEAKELIKEASDLINKNECFKKSKVGVSDKIKSSSINKGFYKSYISAKGWWVKSNCTSCGLCIKKCPLNNIKLINNKPVWGDRCTHCMACISYCPVSAIEFKNKTKNKERYTFLSYTK